MALDLTAILGNRNSLLLLLIGLTVLFFVFFSSRKGGGRERRYYGAKRMNRKQIERYISSLEKSILILDRNIDGLKVKEHNLEIRFSTQRDRKLQKELEKARSKLTELANRRDRLLEEKQAYARAYREVTL